MHDDSTRICHHSLLEHFIENRDHSPCNVLLIHATGRAAAAAKSKSHPLFKAWNMQGHASTRILRQLLVSAFLGLFFRRCLGICCRAYMQSVAPVVSRPSVVSDIALGSRAVRERDCERYVKLVGLRAAFAPPPPAVLDFPAYHCFCTFRPAATSGEAERGSSGGGEGGGGGKTIHRCPSMLLPYTICPPVFSKHEGSNTKSIDEAPRENYYVVSTTVVFCS